MKRNRHIVTLGTIMGLAAVATAGAATPPATRATCDALMKQADTAMAAHHGDANAMMASHEREMGASECNAGHFDKGAQHMRTAITHMGMKPVN